VHRTLRLSLCFALAYGPSAEAQTQHKTVPITDVAHSGLTRFELGLQVADIRTECIGSRYQCKLPSFGLGIGGVVNLNAHFAIDASYLETPQSGEYNTTGGHASEFLIGVRTEVRTRHYGYFLRAQPGYLRWNHDTTGATITFHPFKFAYNYGTGTSLAINLGAGFEYSPTSRVHVRAEVSDLMLHPSRNFRRNDLQPSVGVYYGLGKELIWKPPIYNSEKVHPFFSTPNVSLLTISTLAITSNAITTQRFIGHGLREGIPFERPFVKYGWSGQVGVSALEISAEILAMYGLHRIGQHWIERLLPVSLAITHAIYSYNDRQGSFSHSATYRF
jgi:hypothetical protein